MGFGSLIHDAPAGPAGSRRRRRPRDDLDGGPGSTPAVQEALEGRGHYCRLRVAYFGPASVLRRGIARFLRRRRRQRRGEAGGRSSSWPEPAKELLTGSTGPRRASSSWCLWRRPADRRPRSRHIVSAIPQRPGPEAGRGRALDSARRSKRRFSGARGRQAAAERDLTHDGRGHATIVDSACLQGAQLRVTSGGRAQVIRFHDASSCLTCQITSFSSVRRG
jgi:hypothetical protein